MLVAGLFLAIIIFGILYTIQTKNYLSTEYSRTARNRNPYLVLVVHTHIHRAKPLLSILLLCIILS